MATKTQERKEKAASRAFALSVWSLIFAALTLLFQVYIHWSLKKSYDAKFSSIETSVRLLTATVAPQLLQAVDDSLKAAVNEPATPTVQIEQTFAKVESDTANLRKLKAKIPNQRVNQSAALLEKAVSLHPGSSAAWGAAAQMISYRSDLIVQPKSQQPDCYKVQGPGDWDGGKTVRYHDCTLDLSNVAELFAIGPGLIPAGKTYPERLRYKLVIILTNGTVSYSGGPIIEIETLICVNCAFDFQSPNQIPPPAAQTLSKELLVADLPNVTLSLPTPQA